MTRTTDTLGLVDFMRCHVCGGTGVDKNVGEGAITWTQCSRCMGAGFRQAARLIELLCEDLRRLRAVEIPVEIEPGGVVVRIGETRRRFGFGGNCDNAAAGVAYAALRFVIAETQALRQHSFNEPTEEGDLWST